MALFAADLPHTANVNAVNISDLDLLHHFAVAGAQQPAAVFIGAAAHNVAAITQRLHRADFEAVHRAVIVSGDTRIYTRGAFSVRPLFTFPHKNLAAHPPTESVHLSLELSVAN